MSASGGAKEGGGGLAPPAIEPAKKGLLSKMGSAISKSPKVMRKAFGKAATALSVNSHARPSVWPRLPRPFPSTASAAQRLVAAPPPPPPHPCRRHRVGAR